MSHRRLTRVLFSAALVCLCAALAPALAAAKPVTIGQLRTPTIACNSPLSEWTVTQTTAEGGVTEEIPTDGAIVEWSLESGAVTLPSATLRVVRLGEEEGHAVFTATAEATVGALTEPTVNTFHVDIPVEAGELLGLKAGTSGGDCLVEAGSGDGIGIGPSYPIGTPSPLIPAGGSGFALPISAVVLPPPKATALAPAEGSTVGGTAVTLTGEDLQMVESVTFGGVPAASFSEVSETELRAVAPPGSGSVDVAVKTPAGTATVSKFTYVVPISTTPVTTGTAIPPVRCKVPMLTGKTLASAKRLIKKAGCAVGKVTRPKGVTAATGKVRSQRPKAGKSVPEGEKIAVKLG